MKIMGILSLIHNMKEVNILAGVKYSNKEEEITSKHALAT